MESKKNTIQIKHNNCRNDARTHDGFISMLNTIGSNKNMYNFSCHFPFACQNINFNLVSVK